MSQQNSENTTTQKQVLPKRRAWIPLSAKPQALPYTIEIEEKFTLEHLVKVLRLTIGEKIIAISDTLGVGYIAEITEIKNKSLVMLTLQEEICAEKTRIPKLVLAGGLIKEAHWEWLLQKATELGVSELIPLKTKFTDIQPRMVKPERWQHIVKAAALQCERFTIPKIHTLVELDDFVKASDQRFSKTSLRLFLQERANNIPNLLTLLLEKQFKPQDCSEIILIIGPEGGWHPDEIKSLQENRFQPVSLGNSILRAETASIIALSTVQQAISYQAETST